MFDLNYGDASDSRSNLAATVDAGATVSAAAAILGGIVASNNQTLSSLASGAGSAGLLGSDLLMSIQRQKLGGA